MSAVWWGRWVNLPSSHPYTASGAPLDQMGTAKEKWGRKVKGRLLTKTGGLCPCLDHRLPSVGALTLQTGVIKGADPREAGHFTSLLPPFSKVCISLGFFCFVF